MDILERLLLPFRGFFFASPGGVVDVGDGGGAGDDGGGGDGGAGTDDPGEGGAEEVETEDAGTDDGGEGGDEAAETGEEDAGEGEDGEGGKGKTGGKKPTVESALNKLRKVDAKSAEVLRREHFQNVQYRSAGTPQEVQIMKDFMTLHGGEEEISASIEQGDRFAQELDMVANGDPQIVRDIASENPEGLLKLGPHVLEALQRIDPKKFGTMMAAPMSRLLRETGVVPTLQSIARFIKGGQQQESFDAVKELLEWVANVDKTAEANKEQPISERERELQNRDREVQSKEAKIYRREVGKVSIQRTNAAIGKHLTPLITQAKAKGVILTLEQKQDLASGVYAEISRSLEHNNAYQRQMAAYYKRQADPDEIAEFVESKVAGLAEQATKAVWARKGWAGRFSKTKPGGNGNAGAGSNGRTAAVMINAPPTPDRIDWSKDSNRSRFMGDGRVGEATLKNGKVVRFRW